MFFNNLDHKKETAVGVSLRSPSMKHCTATPRSGRAPLRRTCCLLVASSLGFFWRMEPVQPLEHEPLEHESPTSPLEHEPLQSRQTRPVKRPPSLEAPLQASLSLSCATLARPCRCALPPNRRAPPPNTPTRRAARHPDGRPDPHFRLRAHARPAGPPSASRLL